MRLTKEREEQIIREISYRYTDTQLVKSMTKELLTELDAVRQELHKALDALTVSQEEWLLRVKHLEKENYRLTKRAEYVEGRMDMVLEQEGFKPTKQGERK